MKSEPDFTTTSKWVIVAIGRREEGPADRSVGHRGQMSHYHIKSLDGVHWDASKIAFESFFQSVQRNLRHPFDCYTKDTIFAFTRKCHFKLNFVPSNGQIVTGVHVLSSIKYGLLVAKYFRVALYHRLNNFAIDLAWALVRRDGHIVVMKKASRHCNLEVIGSQCNDSSVSAHIWSTWTEEDGWW